ncbi:MAG: hypothetical protein N3F07_00690 [Candidatus Micrarchaeota archaeon]|nr:hypothetical protein [Candidatus Micrarchaeota archaeon]
MGRFAGQLSMEALLLFVVFLALLGVSLAASSRISSAAQEKISYEKSAADFRLLSQKAESACLLGNGNLRLIVFSGLPPSISADSQTIFFSSGNFSSNISLPCQISIKASFPKPEATIENKNGALEIR